MVNRLGRALSWIGAAVLVLFAYGAFLADKAGNPEFGALALIVGIAAFLIGIVSRYVLAGD